MYQDSSTQSMFSFEIIKTVLENSNDPNQFGTSLTQQMRELLGCKVSVFLHYNNALMDDFSMTVSSDQEDVMSKEIFEHIIHQLNNIQKVTFFDRIEDLTHYLSPFKSLIVVPFKHENMPLGTLILIDIIQLLDIKSVVSALDSISSYLSIVLFNIISQEKLEQLIEKRTWELSHALEEVKRANNSKSAFIANISHEMRTPLNGIIGYIHLLADKEKDPKKLDFIQKASQASQMLLSLISDVLDFSKIESNKIVLDHSLFSIYENAREAINLVKPRATSKDLKIELEIAKSVPTYVVGDSQRFIQILTNLISNAIKFTSKGSVHIFIDAKYVGDQVKLICDVADTGIGIRPENIDKIFDVFVQEDTSTTRNYGGTGLGLSITKNLIEYMGGKIQVESEPGKGSLFSFYIFLDKTSKECIKNMKSSSEYGISRVDYSLDIMVLVVEDNELNLELLNEILLIKNIKADNARNGIEAIELFKKNHYNLIFMDCQMPLMDGFEATRQMRIFENGVSRTKIIALTAGVLESDKEKCYSAGMDDYLPKPINLNHILEKLELIR